MAFILVPTLCFSEVPKCSSVKVNVVGKYGEKGEVSAPILSMWSEVAGNFKSFEIRSKEAFTKSVITLKSEDKVVLSKIETPVVKNKARGFDLMGEIKKQTATSKEMVLDLYSGDTKEAFCQEVVEIIIKDAEGAREVKDDKKM